MKNQALSIFLFFGILVSCSKAEEEATHLIEVFEYKTNTPLASVEIQFVRCSDYDIQFGCRFTEIFAYGNTDDKGRYSFSERVLRRADEGIRLNKAKYWYAEGYTGINYIAPEGWISIQLTRQNVYAFPRLIFQYYLDGESGYTGINPFAFPADTIIKVRAFGNEVNRLNWQIGSGTIFGFDNKWHISPVLANGILTQSPGKFDTTSVTLLY